MSAIGLIETSLRHGQQTLLLSRLRRRHLVPLVERLDDCGLQALDIFGGAPYEVALTHLGEEPFDRLREVRAATRTPLLALLRGQALVGYRQLPDDAVDRFIALAAEAGIDIFRCFDPLNDPRNLARAAAAILAAGKHPEGAIVYTESPVHDLAGFIRLGRVLQRQGYRSLCLYDPAGLLGAGNARALVAGLRDATGLPISLHCATITGQASFAYLAGAEAGASALDVALSPLAGGASLPATEGVCAALRGTSLAPEVDEPRLLAAAAALDDTLAWYRSIADPDGWQYDVGTLRTQLAPSVLAHLRRECEMNGIGTDLPHVLEEIPRVRAEMGYPPLVTPIAEVVVTQAVYNVAAGQRYLTVAQEVRDYFLGLYGRPPGPLDPAVQQVVGGGDAPLTVRPADVLDPALERTRREMAREGLPVTDDVAVLNYLLFPAPTAAWLRGESQAEPLGDEAQDPLLIAAGEAARTLPPPAAAEPEDGGDLGEPLGDAAAVPIPGLPVPPQGGAPLPAPAALSRQYTVEVDGEVFAVRVTGEAGAPGGAVAPVVAPASPRTGAVVVAPMQGLLVRVAVSVGEVVKAGQTVAVLEAMKMQNDITASAAGTVQAVHVHEGQVVSRDQALLTVG